MPMSRQYQVYYAVHLYHWDETWGGNTYNKQLTKDWYDDEVATSDYTQSSSTDFLLPDLHLNKYYIDGPMTGHFGLYNQSAATCTITQFSISLKKTDDVPSNETTLGSVTKTITTNNTIEPSADIFFPIHINIDKQVVNESEKLILHIEYSCVTEISIRHVNGDPADVKIKVPYAYSG